MLPSQPFPHKLRLSLNSDYLFGTRRTPLGSCCRAAEGEEGQGPAGEPGLAALALPATSWTGSSADLTAQHWTRSSSSNSSSSWQMELLMEFICLLVEINKQELISWGKGSFQPARQLCFCLSLTEGPEWGVCVTPVLFVTPPRSHPRCRRLHHIFLQAE